MTPEDTTTAPDLHERLRSLRSRIKVCDETIASIHESRRSLVHQEHEILMKIHGIVPTRTIVFRVRDASKWLIIDIERGTAGKPQLICRKVKRDGELGRTAEKLPWPPDSEGRVEVTTDMWQGETPLL